MRTWYSQIFPVYPRWRGEHAKVAGVGLLEMRFIPAGAGNTQTTGTVGNRSTVYPRWRGEHTCHGINNRYQAGLSPLARGTLAELATNSSALRFIPAGAGNTRLLCGRK